jgi:hypothetical protein
MLQQLFEEGMIDVTVLLPENYYDKTGMLKDDLPENYADDEIHILHMNEVTGISMPGYRYDRRLSDANLEFEHVQSADFHHPSVMSHLESEQ